MGAQNKKKKKKENAHELREKQFNRRRKDKAAKQSIRFATVLHIHLNVIAYCWDRKSSSHFYRNKNLSRGLFHIPFRPEVYNDS